MYRSKSYRRHQRDRVINHKSYIAKHIMYWTEFTPGRFDKGKVHCSCPLCRAKSKQVMGVKNKSINSWKHSDIKKHLSALDKLNDESNA